MFCYLQGKDQQVSDALGRWAYPACPDTQDMNLHGDALEEKYAELCDAAENKYDAFVLRQGDCFEYPQELGMLFAIRWDTCDYSDSK